MPRGKPNKKYSGEFKQEVVEAMRKGNLSCREAEQEFGISRGRVRHWERIYLEEGAEGLYLERRGRESKGRTPKLDKQGKEDLIAEVQRLRAEIAYLKNLQALVLGDERHQRGKRW
jgi:transposase